MNETRELWAVLRADDDSNGLMAAQLAGQPSTVRVLVASSPGGVDSIRVIARGAWPNDELIVRRFVHDENTDDRVPLKLNIPDEYEPTVTPETRDALAEFMEAIDGQLADPANAAHVEIVDEVVTRTLENYGVDLSSRRDLNVLAAAYALIAQLGQVLQSRRANGALGYTVQRAAKELG